MKTKNKSASTEYELIKSKLILNKIHDCIFVFNPENLQFTYVNRAASKQFGISNEDLLMKTPVDILTDYEEDEFCELIKPLANGLVESITTETAHWHRAGLMRPVEVLIQYLDFGLEGCRFVMVARDLTKRDKEKEEYRRLFESSRDAIVITTQKGFIDCNQAALRMFGYENKKDFLKLHPADVSPKYQPNNTFSIDAARSHIDDAKTNKIAFFPWIHKRRDGSEFHTEVLLSPFERNNELVVQRVVRDISERLQAEMDQSKLQAKLLHAQKLESVGQLAAGIAHEINTPTQFIGSNLDFVKDALVDITSLMATITEIAEQQPQTTKEILLAAIDEADWEYLQEELPKAINQSLEGVKRVSTIVRAMKEFSHPGGKEKEPRDLNKIIDTTVTVARNEWKYVAAVDFDLAPDLPLVPILADEIGQVILNILVNAAHAIENKLGKTPEMERGLITIKTKSVTGGVELRITDSGSGIPVEARDRIFDPFFTTKKVGRGTGQGLAISHDVICEKHHGSINFVTELEKGTEFIIFLPQAEKPGSENKENNND